jgi:hypothetical protein
MKYYSRSDQSDKSIRYYRSWQVALADFIVQFGHLYEDAYNLAAEFESRLKQNVKGSYFMYTKGDTNE